MLYLYLFIPDLNEIVESNSFNNVSCSLFDSKNKKQTNKQTNHVYDMPLESTAHEHSIFYPNLILNVSVTTWFHLSDIHVILV